MIVIPDIGRIGPESSIILIISAGKLIPDRKQIRVRESIKIGSHPTERAANAWISDHSENIGESWIAIPTVPVPAMLRGPGEPF